MQLKHTPTLITGASRGLGRALAVTLAARGARVVAVARHRQALERTVDDIRETGGEAFAIVADVGDKHEIHSIAAQAAQLAGPIELLINNASTLGPTPLHQLLDTECEELEHILRVNLLGPFRLTRALAGNMAVRGRGTIVNISSDAAVEAYPEWGGYGASKAALDHMTRTWAAELTNSGVSLVSVDPGEMNTAMHAAALPDVDPNSLADPADVSCRIADLIEKNSGTNSGQRLVAADWTVAT